MYNIIIPYSQDMTTQSIRMGWLNALKHLGHAVTLWDSVKPALDAFDETKAELVFARTGELTRPLYKAIRRNNAKLMLFLDADAETTDTQIAIVDKLLKDGHFVIPFVHSRVNIEQTHAGWLEMGLVPHESRPGADTIRFKQGKYREEFACDISYIGTWRPEKASLLKRLEEKYNLGYYVRIYGYGNWNHPLHIGAITSNEVYADVICSSRLNIRQHNAANDKFYKIQQCLGDNCKEIGGFYENGDLYINEITTSRSSYISQNSYINRIQEMLKLIKSE